MGKNLRKIILCKEGHVIHLKAMTSDIEKPHNLPRLFCPDSLGRDRQLILSSEQCHYVVGVMRRKEGQNLRLFNARDGEWLAQIMESHKKKTVLKITTQLRAPAQMPVLHLFFGILRKHRQDLLIEKATELGATHLTPLLTDHVHIRQFNKARTALQAIEATEQSERLCPPHVYEAQTIGQALSDWPAQQILYVGCTRSSERSLSQVVEAEKTPAVMVGPEGGFSESEQQQLASYPFVRFFQMGGHVLRSETAALAALAILNEVRNAH